MYRIIGDGCMELTDEMKKSKVFVNVERSANGEQDSAPSVEDYINTFHTKGEMYVIVMSSQLSLSYYHAMLARAKYVKQHPSAKIVVFDSRTTSCGQTLIARFIKEQKEQGVAFEDMTSKVKDYRSQLKTKFVFESLDKLKKSGRLSYMGRFVADKFSTKSVMKWTAVGTIDREYQVRGMKYALVRLAEAVKVDITNPSERVLAISYCGNRRRAEFVKEQIEKMMKFREIILVEHKDDSLYAQTGGVIVAY